MKPWENASEKLRSKAALPRDAEQSMKQSPCLMPWPARGQCRNCRGNVATVDAVARPSPHQRIYWHHEHPFRKHLQALTMQKPMWQPKYCSNARKTGLAFKEMNPSTRHVYKYRSGHTGNRAMGQVQGAAVRIREAKGQLHGECTMIKHREMSAKGVKCSHVEIEEEHSRQRWWFMRPQRGQREWEMKRDGRYGAIG